MSMHKIVIKARAKRYLAHLSLRRLMRPIRSDKSSTYLNKIYDNVSYLTTWLGGKPATSPSSQDVEEERDIINIAKFVKLEYGAER